LKTANRELSENELRSRLMHEYMMRINELLDPDYQSAS
jgi:hypothetical protein